jgi:hypothetical protein
LNLIYKKNKNKRKRKILKNSKLKVAHAFLAPAELGPAHGFNGLTQSDVLGNRGYKGVRQLGLNPNTPPSHLHAPQLLDFSTSCHLRRLPLDPPRQYYV